MGQKVHPLALRLGISTKPQSRWYYHKRLYRYMVLEDKLIRSYISKVHSDCQPIEINISRTVKWEMKDHLFNKPNQISKTNQNSKIVNSYHLLIELFAGEYNSFYANEDDKVKWRSRFHNPKRFKQTYPRLPLKETIEQTTKALYQLCIPLRNKYRVPQLTKLEFISKPFELPTRHRYTNATMIANHLIQNLENRERFRRSLKKLFQHLLKNRELTYQDTQKIHLRGLKIQISGRLDGVEKAKTHWIRAGRIPLHTLRAKVDYCSKSAKTIYGILGIKVWTY